jgi:hypothetical protein
MTYAPTNLGLAPDAEARLDNYLRQVRAALTGTPDVSPDEIEADIREHVENELQTCVRPVSLSVLEAVLNRLGPPTQWLPTGRATPRGELLSVWKYASEQYRRIKNTLWRGPEDWRLAYLAFGTFAFGFFVFLIGTQEDHHSRGSATMPLGIMSLIVSYILSRAGVSLLRQNGGVVDSARKWLLYPPLVLVSLVLLLALVVSPPIIATAGSYEAVRHADRQERWELAGEPRGAHFPDRRYLSNDELKKQYPDVETTLDKFLAQLPRIGAEPLAVLFLFVGCGSLWGAVVGLLASRFPATVRALFVPLGNGFGGKWAGRVGLACFAILVIWCGLVSRIATDAGLL